VQTPTNACPVTAFEGPLPEDYAEFKALVNTKHGAVYDTKQISTMCFPKSHFKTTALEPLYRQLLEQAADEAMPSQPSVGVQLPLGFDAYNQLVLDTYKQGAGRAHEAAFDAYITGVAFLLLRGAVGEQTLEEHKGVVPLFRSIYAVDLGSEEDRLVAPGAVVHLGGFGTDIKSVDLESLTEHSVRFMWIDDTSTLAVFEDSSVSIETACGAFSQATFPMEVQSLADFKAAEASRMSLKRKKPDDAE